MAVLAPDEFTDSDHQLVDAFVGFPRTFVGLAHVLVGLAQALVGLADAFVQAFVKLTHPVVSLAHAFVGLAHPPIRFFELLRYSIEPPACLRRQLSDQLLERNLILGDDSDDPL